MTEHTEALTEAERLDLDIAAIDDRDRSRGYSVLGPGGTDGQTPTVYEVVERILAARIRAAVDAERVRLLGEVEERIEARRERECPGCRDCAGGQRDGVSIALAIVRDLREGGQ